jgi:hypothetical protein
MRSNRETHQTNKEAASASCKKNALEHLLETGAEVSDELG